MIAGGLEKIRPFDLLEFRKHPDDYTILDVRNPAEVNAHLAFKSAINIPLFELRERVSEIPGDKPVIVHCAAGHRSAAATSIVADKLSPETLVLDMGDDIKKFL